MKDRAGNRREEEKDGENKDEAEDKKEKRYKQERN